MKRAIIVAKGKVQKVRYRNKVKEIADKLGIVGEAENLEDGSVRIVADGEKERLDDFINRIKMKNYLIDVKEVSVSFEEATGEFGMFRKVISGTMYEVAERLDEAANLLERLTGVVMSGNEKIIGTIEQGNDKIVGTIEQGNEMLGGKQDQTIEILKSVREDTEVISEDIGEIKDALIIITGIREETKELSAKYDALSKDVEEIKKILMLRK